MEDNQTKNKKIIGATQVTFDGKSFKSKLEKSCYALLLASGLNFTYESEKITLLKGFYLEKVKYYGPTKRNIFLSEINTKIRDITYTPDFVVIHKNYKIYIEAKGRENDIYPVKKKLFLSSLNFSKDSQYTFFFFEPHNIRQMKQVIKLIHEL
jgi:hypothetical protein